MAANLSTGWCATTGLQLDPRADLRRFADHSLVDVVTPATMKTLAAAQVVNHFAGTAGEVDRTGELGNVALGLGGRVRDVAIYQIYRFTNHWNAVLVHAFEWTYTGKVLAA